MIKIVNESFNVFTVSLNGEDLTFLPKNTKVIFDSDSDVRVDICVDVKELLNHIDFYTVLELVEGLGYELKDLDY